MRACAIAPVPCALPQRPSALRVVLQYSTRTRGVGQRRVDVEPETRRRHCWRVLPRQRTNCSALSQEDADMCRWWAFRTPSLHINISTTFSGGLGGGACFHRLQAVFARVGRVGTAVLVAHWPQFGPIARTGPRICRQYKNRNYCVGKTRTPHLLAIIYFLIVPRCILLSCTTAVPSSSGSTFLQVT